MMSKKILTWTMAGILMAAAVIPAAAAARQGGRMNGQTQQIRTQANLQIKNQQRLRDGSCVVGTPKKAAPNAQKKGYTYGPGDGTGNQNLGPQDGTGYGAPVNR